MDPLLTRRVVAAAAARGVAVLAGGVFKLEQHAFLLDPETWGRATPVRVNAGAAREIGWRLCRNQLGGSLRTTGGPDLADV